MDGKTLNASLAYVQALKRSAGPGVEGGDNVGSAGQAGPSFAELLSDIAENVVDATKQSELMGVRAAAKQVELVDVITAVTNAEVALESVVAVRDRVVQAYQDIMRMPI